MKVTFLGTGTSQGVPVIGCQCNVCQSDDPKDNRLRTSVLIETGNVKIVIDCGPDFRQQMLREKITAINAILITHSHKDHIGGLDDVRAFNYIQQKPAEVYATDEVQQAIKREFSYAFGENRYPGVPEIHLHSIRNSRFVAAGVDILPIKARHFNDQYVFGFRIGDFSYLTDAVEITDEEKNKMKGSKVIVINALRKKTHYSHFTLEGALKILSELKPEHGYLTHISHQMGKDADIEKELPGFVRLAYDRQQVVI